MGTDIHLRLEAKTPDGWKCIKPCWPQYPYPKDENGETIWPTDDPTERNYNVFAFLAGVRNGYGFAFCYRHKPIEPAFAGRGIPTNSEYNDPHDKCETDEDFEAIPRGVWLGEHSFTWATITELQALEWEAEFTSGGYVPAEVYEALPVGQAPDVFFEGVMGDSIQMVQAEDYEAMKALNDLDEHIQYRVFVTWKWRPLMDSGFYAWLTGDKLAAVIEQYGADNLRLLMGFDS